MGGGAGVLTAWRFTVTGRSPRGRRSQLDGFGKRIEKRSISAWAEEPSPFRWLAASARVDLRVGGGAATSMQTGSIKWGRSPRGRRSQMLMTEGNNLSGSISARAEEPLPLKKLISLYLSKNTRQWSRTGLRTSSEPSCSTRSFGGSPKLCTLNPPGAPASRHAIVMLPRWS